jgi:hypothetical protein
MKVFIKKTKSSVVTWQQQTTLIINTHKGGDLFDYTCFEEPKSTPISFGGVADYKGVETLFIKDFLSNKKFVENLDKLIAKELAIQREDITVPLKEWGEVYDTLHFFVIEILCEKIPFQEVLIPLEKGNMLVKYGKCLIPSLQELEITKSERIRPCDWYEGEHFGNQFNGGVKYYYKGNAPAFELAEGYEFTHKSAGSINGYGSGFKGGSYIQKI